MQGFLLCSFPVAPRLRSVRTAKVCVRHRGKLSVPVYPSGTGGIPVLPVFSAVDTLGSPKIDVITACFDYYAPLEQKVLFTALDSVVLVCSRDGNRDLQLHMNVMLFGEVLHTFGMEELEIDQELQNIGHVLGEKGIDNIQIQTDLFGRTKITFPETTWFHLDVPAADTKLDLLSEQTCDLLLGIVFLNGSSDRMYIRGWGRNGITRDRLMMHAVCLLFKQDELNRLRVENIINNVISQRGTLIPTSDKALAQVKRFCQLTIETYQSLIELLDIIIMSVREPECFQTARTKLTTYIQHMRELLCDFQTLSTVDSKRLRSVAQCGESIRTFHLEDEMRLFETWDWARIWSNFHLKYPETVKQKYRQSNPPIGAQEQSETISSLSSQVSLIIGKKISHQLRSMPTFSSIPSKQSAGVSCFYGVNIPDLRHQSVYAIAAKQQLWCFYPLNRLVSNRPADDVVHDMWGISRSERLRNSSSSIDLIAKDRHLNQYLRITIGAYWESSHSFQIYSLDIDQQFHEWEIVNKVLVSGHLDKTPFYDGDNFTTGSVFSFHRAHLRNGHIWVLYNSSQDLCFRCYRPSAHCSTEPFWTNCIPNYFQKESNGLVENPVSHVTKHNRTVFLAYLEIDPPKPQSEHVCVPRRAHLRLDTLNLSQSTCDTLSTSHLRSHPVLVRLDTHQDVSSPSMTVKRGTSQLFVFKWMELSPTKVFGVWLTSPSSYSVYCVNQSQLVLLRQCGQQQEIKWTHKGQEVLDCLSSNTHNEIILLLHPTLLHREDLSYTCVSVRVNI